MSGFDLYVFIVCAIVYIMLILLLGYMLSDNVKQELKAIARGLEDEQITTEYYKSLQDKRSIKLFCNFFTIVLTIAMLVVFGISMYVQLSNGRVTGGAVVPKVVMSGSMSYKNPANTYLEENGIDDQFSRFDLIFVEALPDQYDLKLYDTVMYEYRGEMIIHRIIDIEEPNEEHPNERYFQLRGDAIRFSDDYPVLYEQMRAIYRGEHIPHVGSFFAFMQSPAGWLCIILILFAVIATPMTEKKIWNAKLNRLKAIGVISDEKVGLGMK